jgi:hypothetical protein
MIVFDKKGNLSPYEPIQATVAELEKYFVESFESATRRDNFEKYIRYSSDLKKLLGDQPLRQWVNGSFVTKKNNPKDVDLITFIDHKTVRKLGSKLDDFRPRLSWEKYGVDAYLLEVYPDSSEFQKFTRLDIAEWQDLFSKSRPNRKGQKFKKGFLEIIY